MKFYIYKHIRLDTNTPFYVGKGTANRYRIKRGRSQLWNRIVNKYGYTTEIILDNLTEDEAFLKEIEFIKLYKSQGWCEANFTNGGEGASGAIVSEERRRKVSEFHKGKVFSEEYRRKISEAKRGKRPYIASPETKKKISETLKKQWEGGIRQGKPRTKEQKEKMSETFKLKYKNGYINPMKGKEQSEDHKKKISAANKGKAKPSFTKEHRKRMSEAKKGKAPWNKGKTGVYTKEMLEKMSKSHRARIRKPLSLETKRKISEAHLRRSKIK